MLVKRMQQICSLLEKEESVEIKTLSRQLNVTEKTIRQDLIKLEQLGLLRRVRGGAILVHNSNSIFPLSERRKLHVQEKERIAKEALSFVKDGDVIFLDNGTTTQAIAKLLRNKPVIIISNDITILYELRDAEAVTLYSTGGKLQRVGLYYSYVGPDAAQMIGRHNIDIAFLGTSALSLEKGIMTFSELEAEAKTAVIRASDRVICVADSTKINQQAFVHVASLSELDCLITDAGIGETLKEQIEKESGIEVRVV